MTRRPSRCSSDDLITQNSKDSRGGEADGGQKKREGSANKQINLSGSRQEIKSQNCRQGSRKQSKEPKKKKTHTRNKHEDNEQHDLKASSKYTNEDRITKDK